MRAALGIIVACAAGSISCCALADEVSTFNGDLKADKFVSDTQIDPQNVAQLAKAWEVHTGDV